jgi:hypothetical protein
MRTWLLSRRGVDRLRRTPRRARDCPAWSTGNGGEKTDRAGFGSASVVVFADIDVLSLKKKKK